MSSLRKFYRQLLLILLIIIGIIFTVFFCRNTIPPHSISSHVIRSWLGVVARSLGIKIKTFGTALSEKTLFVANHISWLDILVLGYLSPVHFLSKHEVKTMPVIGWLATRAGTLYIHRGNRESASESSREITEVLKQKHNSLIFAEGTTTDGHIKKFHSRTLQSAIDAGAMVQPIAIFYPTYNPQTQQTEINPATLFLGGMTIGESADRIFRESRIDVEVHYLKPIDSNGKTRDEIAKYAYDEVVDAIKSIRRRSAEVS